MRRPPEELAERATHLIALRESPSYPILKDILEKRIAVETRRLVSTPIALQQGLDWGRGFIYGLQTLVVTIEKGEQELERAIKQARALEALEGAEGE
jgi:hypothetical protein